MQQHLSILPYFCDAVQRSLDDGLPLGESASSSNFPHFFAIRTGWKDIVLLLHVLHASTPILDTGCTRLYNKHDSRKSDIVEQTLLRLLQHEWESAKSEELASNGAVNESTDVYVRYSSTVCKIVTFGNPLKDEEKWKSAILTRLALRWLDGRVHLDENQKDSLCNDDNLIVATSTLTALFEKVIIQIRSTIISLRTPSPQISNQNYSPVYSREYYRSVVQVVQLTVPVRSRLKFRTTSETRSAHSMRLL